MSDKRSDITGRLRDAGVVAVVRVATAEVAVDVVRALAAGGVVAAEVTFTVPDADKAIAELSKLNSAGEFGRPLVLGAGTVVTAAQARAAVDAGAEYLVSPHLSEPVMAAADQLDVAALPGALTPTEVFAAFERGADVVKVFPAARMGPKYLKDLAGPYPKIPLMPTGGVSATNVHEWVACGAVAVGVGSELVDKAAVAAGDWQTLTDKAAKLTEALAAARASVATS